MFCNHCGAKLNPGKDTGTICLQHEILAQERRREGKKGIAVLFCYVCGENIEGSTTRGHGLCSTHWRERQEQRGR